MKHRLLLWVWIAMLCLTGPLLQAHPMGNFSVSHYSRIEVNGHGARVHYVLDLAEIPTFQLLQQWKLDPAAPQAELEGHAAAQAREWVRNLSVQVGGKAMSPRLEKSSLKMDKGAGGMAVMRVTADFSIDAAPGKLEFEDRNYPDRAGWKEIVIVAGKDAVVQHASPDNADRSQELTAYPQDPLIAPPQDLIASLGWQSTAPVLRAKSAPLPPASATSETVAPPVKEPPPSPTTQPPGQNAPGTVVRGDYLSRMLHQGDIGWGMILAGMVVAFGLGAVHALSPGHGKTIVAAYLVGTRGTPKHAIFLGGMVTFTHTISVFFLGLTTLFLSQYVLPEKIYPVLGAISGLSIVWIGTTLFFKRLSAAKRGGHHYNNPLVHDHGDGHVHSHVPEGDVSMASLVALGASGGLVPCPSALVLLLSSVALGRVALGLTLLVAFSAGLAMVLMAIGLVVLYAKHLLPDSQKTARSPLFRYVPVASAAVITCAGLLMTGVALGVIRPFAGV